MPERPLLVTSDPGLLDDLHRLAAAAGVDVAVSPDVGVSPAAWSRASLVLVGGDAAVPLTRARLPRRAGVLLVPRAGDDEEWAFSVAASAGVEAVQVLPRAESLIIDRLVAAAGQGIGGRVLGVVPGRGGAGASTLSVALARTATRLPRLEPTMLVDGDPLGGGLDLLLGCEGAPGLRWPDLVAARGPLDPVDLAAALPRPGGVTLLSWHRGRPADVPPEVVEAVIRAARRGHRLVVVDLPRQLDPIARAVVAQADLVLLVVPAEVRAAAAAGALAAVLAGWTPDVQVVVRGPAATGLTPTQVADSLALPLAGGLDPEPGLAAALDRGDPPPRTPRSPLGRLCRDVLDSLDVSTRPAA